MEINKLSNTLIIPYKIIKGSVSQRQQKANKLVEDLYDSIEPYFKDDYSSLSFENLQNKVNSVLPAQDLKVIVMPLSEEDAKECGAISKVLYDKDKNAKAVTMELPGKFNSVRAVHLPHVLHEFQHVADDLFQPKLLSRLQKMNKRGLLSKKYDKFYDDYYYCHEVIDCKQDKKDVLKIIENKTRKFLKHFSVSDKIDYLQDMRYSLISEVAAYDSQIRIAKKLTDKNFLIRKYEMDDYPEQYYFGEKIALLKKMISEIITKERQIHRAKLKKRN